MSDTIPAQTDHVKALFEFEAEACAEVLLPVATREIGKPATATQLRNPELSHKIASDEFVGGKLIDLIVLACNSNALRCRLLESTRDVTLPSAVRDEIVDSIITVMPKRLLWTHRRHPCHSCAVYAVRIDTSVLGLNPLPLIREDVFANSRGVMEAVP